MKRTGPKERKLLDAALLRWTHDLAGHGILITDADLKIRSWNRWLEERSGLGAADVLGRNLLEVYGELEKRRLDKHYKWVLEGQTSILSQRLHGHLLPLPTDPTLSGFTEMQQTARISPLIDEDGGVIGTLTVIEDVTERVAREAELQAQVDARTQALAREKAAREEAEQANHLKDEFLATVSHELRTPLTAILGWSNMLLNGRLDGGARDRALETIHRNAQAQNQLISDLLDISRIISGKLRLDLRTVDLPSIIEAAVEATRPAAEAKGVRLDMELNRRAGPVSGDADRLQQVVWNLLTNAIKFTPEGGEVLVTLESVGSRVESRTSSTASARQTPAPTAPTAGWGWGSPSSDNWSSCTAAPSGPRAWAKGGGPPSSSACPSSPSAKRRGGAHAHSPPCSQISTARLRCRDYACSSLTTRLTRSTCCARCSNSAG
jgi:signal transduction histidine kinase